MLNETRGNWNMKVRDILDAKGHHVITIRPDATIATAVHRMAMERVGALVVSEVSEDGPTCGFRRCRPGIPN